MIEVYNMRIGDMVWSTHDSNGEEANIVGLVYKLTPRYIYYAVCARLRNEPDGDHFITKDNKVKKTKLYEAIKKSQVGVSYAGGIKKRRRVAAIQS